MLTRVHFSAQVVQNAYDKATEKLKEQLEFFKDDQEKLLRIKDINPTVYEKRLKEN